MSRRPSRARTSRSGAHGLYIEILIRADLDEVWRLTQDPSLHPRWDLRFSSIVPDGSLPGGGSRFTYERALGVHTIRGTGVSIGERANADGGATSALRFDTDDPWSPLRDGRGYWRYIQTPDGVRFITGYDYEPGFGKLADRVIRPFVRWMTAWSFDRLRIWAETGAPPERWPVASAAMFWRRGRPRARRCRTSPPARGAFSFVPDSLAALGSP
ncbi:SRPBCC family protein [Agromyces laixinhei]|uniref:SRPBCC family protein n=1 Tax=Agromyces laixinhei TaxID=2585717 RepID=UPI0012ECC980|nr:SRPBCC family protein [Agromyces laixinhei]